MATAAQLIFHPEQAALFATRVMPQCPLMWKAAVYLACALEYFTEAVLDMSAKMALDGTGFISTRHIFLALQTSDELREMCGHCVVRESGGVRAIHPTLLCCPQDTNLTPFERQMVAHARAANPSMPAFVDPRDGLHYLVSEEGTLSAFSVLAGVCKDTQRARRQLAWAALPEDDKRLVKEEGYHVRNTGDNRKGRWRGGGEWEEELPVNAHLRRLREIRHMQATTHLVLDPEIFALLVRTVCRDCHTNPTFTAEAMECVQTYAEQYLVDQCAEAYGEALRAKRMHLTVNDLSLVGRLRGSG